MFGWTEEEERNWTKVLTSVTPYARRLPAMRFSVSMETENWSTEVREHREWTSVEIVRNGPRSARTTCTGLVQFEGQPRLAYSTFLALNS
jgi:hypothetical protein